MKKHKQTIYKARRVDTGAWIKGYLAYSESEDKYFMHKHNGGIEPKHKLYNIEVYDNYEILEEN